MAKIWPKHGKATSMLLVQIKTKDQAITTLFANIISICSGNYMKFQWHFVLGNLVGGGGVCNISLYGKIYTALLTTVIKSCLKLQCDESNLNLAQYENV